MNYKTKGLIIGLLFLVLLNISIVSANENITEINEMAEDTGYESLELENSNYSLESNCYQEEDYNLSSGTEDILTYDSTYGTVIRVTPNNVPISKSFVLNVTVCLSINGNVASSISGGTVTLKINNNQYTSDVHSGKATFNIPALNTAGSYSCTGDFSGYVSTSRSSAPYGGYTVNTNTFSPSSTKFTLTVYEDPMIVMSSLNTYYNSGKKYDIEIIDKNSKIPLKNKYLTITLQNKNTLYTYSYSGYTNSKGIYQLLLNQDVGEYVITAKINGQSESKDILISKPSTKISISNIYSDNKHYTTLKATIKDNNGNLVNKGTVKFVIDGKSYSVDVNKGVASKKLKLSSVKNYEYQVTFSDGNYISSTSSAKVYIANYKVKISAKKYSNVKGEKTVLKAIIKDGWGKSVNEGTVKFQINGKSYNVKVHNGVAKKKIKLPSVKTYKYKASFSSKYFKTKASKSKVIVKKVPTYTVKIGNYKIKISYKDYKKIKRAINKGYYFSKKYFTGKTTYYKVYTDKKIILTKNKLWMDDTPYSEKTYPSAWETPYGYKFVRVETKRIGNHVKTYMVYKKSTYKKVFVNYKPTKVYIVVNADGWWGATAQLYHIKYKYDGETSWYLGNSKHIF